jgi:hypothetical protein
LFILPPSKSAGGWPGITALVMMLNCERTNPHPARVGCAGGKSIRRARRCARRKLVAIALEVVPLKPKVVAHAKNVVPLVRDAVANATATPLLGFMLSRICARWSRTIQRKDRSRFLGTRCGPGLSRFHQMVTRKRQRTARSGRVTARFDPRWANFVRGNRSRTAGARASVAGRRDRIEWDAIGLNGDAIALDGDAIAQNEDAVALNAGAIASNAGAIARRVLPLEPAARAPILVAESSDCPLERTPSETIVHVDSADPRSTCG